MNTHARPAPFALVAPRSRTAERAPFARALVPARGVELVIPLLLLAIATTPWVFVWLLVR